MALNIFDQLINDLAGTQRGEAIEAKAAPILLPLEGLAASAAETEINSLVNHNLGAAVQQMQTGLSKIGLGSVDSMLVQAIVAGSLQNFGIKIGSALTPDTPKTLDLDSGGGLVLGTNGALLQTEGT